MSLFRTLVISFAVLSFGLAFAEDQHGQSKKPAASSAQRDSANTVVSDQPSAANYDFFFGPSRQKVVLNPDLLSTCYTMRTYVVRRDGPELDSVHPVGYTSCQPAPRFEVKITTQQKHNHNESNGVAAQW